MMTIELKDAYCNNDDKPSLCPYCGSSVQADVVKEKELDNS